MFQYNIILKNNRVELFPLLYQLFYLIAYYRTERFTVLYIIYGFIKSNWIEIESNFVEQMDAKPTFYVKKSC